MADALIFGLHPCSSFWALQISLGFAIVAAHKTLASRRDVTAVFVAVRDNNVDQALRVLKKKMQREGLFREMKNRRAFEKPSERRAREVAESTRRVRKLQRKRMEREGF